MSDDSNKKPASLSTLQATANLDDVLASLEKQTGTQPNAQPEINAIPEITEVPIVQVAEAPAPSLPPALPVDTTSPTAQSPVIEEPIVSESVVTAPVVTKVESPFQIEEKQFEPEVAVTAPIADVLPSTEAVQDHPQMKTDTAVSFAESPTPTVASPTPKSEKKGFLSGFSLTPKFIGAALVVALIAIGSVGAYVAFQTPTGSVNINPKATGCHITYAGNAFSLSGCVGAGTITVFNGPSCPTTQTKVSEVPAQDTGYNPQPPQGQCQQVDHNFGGIDGTGATIGAGGVCTCNNVAPPKKSCGETCASDNDCINPSGSGGAVVCRNGTCESAACPAGMTQPGLNCACKAGRSCGQTCGTGIGLCADGKSTCTYINTNGPACPWGWGTFYCAGSLNGYQRLMCSSGDTGGGYLKGPTGKMSGFTPAEIAASCTPAQPTATPTPTPTVRPTPTLTPTPTPTMTPTPTPTTAPLVCIGISSDTPQPVVGSQVRFTCAKINGATSYEFRYKYSFAGANQNIGTIPTNDNISEPLVISQAATYKVQCRSCVGQSCTPWEAW